METSAISLRYSADMRNFKKMKTKASIIKSMSSGKVEAPKKVAVIDDLSGYGRCSLAVVLPIISALGLQACPVPTAILSNHTGFPSEYKYDFTDHMEPYIQAWEQLKLNFDGIMAGYMNYDEQVKIAAEFITKFKKDKTIVLVDPAMADHGRLYRGFTEDYVGYVKDRLVRQATVIKPNITEACMLTGFDYGEIVSAAREHTMRRLKSHLMYIVDDLRKLGPVDVVITGLDRGDRILNTLADKDGVKFISVRKTGQNRSGTGDIFSSVLLSSLMLNMSLEHAVRKAADFVGSAIALSEAAGMPVAEGVMFERIMSRLSATADQSGNIKN